MPERLTESLVRRGLLDPLRAREAMQRQVLLGGALDTCLFELELASEEALVDAMGSVFDGPTAVPTEVHAPVDARALRAFPEQWAKKHLLAPIALDPEAKTLSVLSPAPADLNLLERLGELLELELTPRLAAEFRVHQRLALLYGEAPPERFRVLIERAADGKLAKPVEAPRSAPVKVLGFGEAVVALRDAKTRDDIIDVALAYAHRELEYAAVFTVHEKHLDGLAAVGDGAERIHGVSLSLEAESAFKVVLETQAYSLGPLPEHAIHVELLRRLGRSSPRAALIVPVRIKGRTIALLYGENAARPIPPRLAADLMLFMTHVQSALEALLVRRKSESVLPHAVEAEQPAPVLEPRTERVKVRVVPRGRPVDEDTRFVPLSQLPSALTGLDMAPSAIPASSASLDSLADEAAPSLDRAELGDERALDTTARAPDEDLDAPDRTPVMRGTDYTIVRPREPLERPSSRAATPFARITTASPPRGAGRLPEGEEADEVLPIASLAEASRPPEPAAEPEVEASVLSSETPAQATFAEPAGVAASSPPSTSAQEDGAWETVAPSPSSWEADLEEPHFDLAGSAWSPIEELDRAIEFAQPEWGSTESSDDVLGARTIMTRRPQPLASPLASDAEWIPALAAAEAATHTPTLRRPADREGGIAAIPRTKDARRSEEERSERREARSAGPSEVRAPSEDATPLLEPIIDRTARIPVKARAASAEDLELVPPTMTPFVPALEDHHDTDSLASEYQPASWALEPLAASLGIGEIGAEDWTPVDLTIAERQERRRTTSESARPTELLHEAAAELIAPSPATGAAAETPPPAEGDAPSERASARPTRIAENEDGSALVDALDAIAIEEGTPRSFEVYEAETMLAARGAPERPAALEGGATEANAPWEAVQIDAWDEWAPKDGEAPSAAPAGKLEAPSMPASWEPPPKSSLVEDSTVPDLSAEAWIRASSEVVRARPLPPEVVERAAMPPIEEPVLLTHPSHIVHALPIDEDIGELAAEGPEGEDEDEQEVGPESTEEPVPLTAQMSLRPRTGDLPSAEPAPSPRPTVEELPVIEPVEDLAAELEAPLEAQGPLAETTEIVERPRGAARELERLINQIVSPNPAERLAARGLLIARGPDVLPKVMERFPGLLSVDPFAPASTLPPLGEVSDVLGVVAAFGALAHPYVIRKLDAPDAAQRFFAVYFYAVVFVPEAIPRLVQRLHDEEPRICMLAARTLFSYRELPDFQLVLDHLHGRLDATSITARRHAAYLIGLFRDVTAIPKLIAVFDRKEKGLFEAAEGALAEITKQRLGPNPKKWRAWWGRNQTRSRIGWLVDGLASKESAMRRSAAEELRAVTGIDFGYDEDASRKSREDARLRWVRWWADQHQIHHGHPDGAPAS